MEASTSNLAAAQALIQQELAQQNGNHEQQDERIPPPLDMSSLPSLQAHFERLNTANDEEDTRPKLDSSRFTLPAPPDGLNASEDEWRKALDNAYVQLSHQEGRAINIDLMKRYGANHWRIHNYTLEAALSRYTASTAHTTDTLSASTNRTRRLLQQDAESKLSTLEAKWAQLVSTQLQMGVATLGAEYEVGVLREERERLRSRLAELEGAA
ncbi:hypothetical protein CF326_g1349 [Tilletia indica]|nr:hypothetical protein CF326_g1349 [Tilletia indica]